MDTAEKAVEAGQEVPHEPQQPTIEDVAKEMGWNPDHEGPEKIDAAEFVRRKPLFDKIKAQSRELKEIRKSVDLMAATYQEMSKKQYLRGIIDAEKRMREAEATGDVAGFKQANDEKNALEQGMNAPNKPLPQEIQDFCERNPWFDRNKVMQADAIEYREKYVKLNPGAPLNEVLEYVEKKIKRDYPEEFEPKQPTPKKPTAPVVEGGGGGNAKSDPLAKLKASMSAEERRVMKMFTENGKMTEAEYLKSYSEVRDK